MTEKFNMIKVAEKVANKKFEYWKEEFIKKLKEEINNRYYKEKKVDGLHYEDVNEEIDKLSGELK